MLVPAADCGHHAAGVGQEAWPEPSGGAAALPTQHPARLFDGAGPQHGDASLWHRDEEAPLATQRDGQRLGLDLDPPLSPSNLEGRSRLEPGLAPYALRDHESARRVDGRSHGIKPTTDHAMVTRAGCSST